jgi:hypothetical protein
MSCHCRAHLANALANEALFDEGVEAARNACVAGATLAAASITASAWYDNPLTGTRALLDCLAKLDELPLSLEAWQRAFAPRTHPETQDDSFSPGFGFVSEEQGACLLSAACRLADCPEAERLRFYLSHSGGLGFDEALNAAGLAAFVYSDHAVSADDAEREFLLSRVDVAIREAARARSRGIAHFPFFSEAYIYEGTSPKARSHDLSEAMRKVGL